MVATSKRIRPEYQIMDTLLTTVKKTLLASFKKTTSHATPVERISEWYPYSKHGGLVDAGG